MTNNEDPEFYRSERQHNYSGDASWVDIRTLAKPFHFTDEEIAEIRIAQQQRLSETRQSLDELSATKKVEGAAIESHNYSGDPEWVNLDTLNKG